MSEQPAEQQCIFCHIANGKIPAKSVYEDDKVNAVLDINPAAPGHILLLPKEHVQIMPQMDDALTKHVGLIAKQLSESVIRGMQVDGTSIFIANGPVAGQRAPHFMLHIIPRSEGDKIDLQLTQNSLDPKVMEQVFDKLSPGIPKHLGAEPAKKEAERQEPDEKPKESPKEESKEGQAQEKSEKVEEKPANQDKSSADKKPNLDSISNLLTGGGK